MPSGGSLGWAYGDRDPWHGESDQEDEYREEQPHSRVCKECGANLDIEGHEAFCGEKGD
jgi:hypothetical protein